MAARLTHDDRKAIREQVASTVYWEEHTYDEATDAIIEYIERKYYLLEM